MSKDGALVGGEATLTFLCCQKAAAKAETLLNSLPANPPSNPQTPTAQSQKTQNGHNLEEVNIRTSSPLRAREAGPELRRAWLCREDGTKVRFSADTITLPPPLHPQLPAAWAGLPLQFYCDSWRLQGCPESSCHLHSYH